MKRTSILSVTVRIAISLAVIFGLFILLTQLSISGLTRVTVLKHLDANTLPAAFSAIEADLDTLRRLVLFYLIGGVAIALILGAIVIRRQVGKPLRRINDALERVATGHLDTTIPVEGARELAELGVSFNRMTHTLKEQHHTLEERLSQIESSAKALQEAQDRLIRSAKLASVGTLAAGVAHEIGNPLAGVLGLMETLEAEGKRDPSLQEKYFPLMRREIERIDRIIRELLDFARVPEADDDEKLSADLGEVLPHLSPLLKAQRLFDHIEVEAKRLSPLPRLAIGFDDLVQLFLNLFLNAVQAMNGRGRITIDAAVLEAWRPQPDKPFVEAMQIRVTDTGPGVDQQHRDNIFDPFFSKRSKGAGTGLGLAICQSICDRAGGDITLDTGFSSGARFIITLPLAAPHGDTPKESPPP